MPKYKFSEFAYNINIKKMPEPGDEEMYIGLEHLDSGSLKVKRWGSDVPITGEKLVMKKGDILFGRRNTYLRRAAIAPHNGIFSAHGMIFRPNTDIMDEDYFPFFISSDYFMNAAIRISVGSLSPTVNWKTLKDLEFDIPDLESQRKSAELLTAANRLKESYEILLEQTDELVKSQFIEMFGDPIENPLLWEKQELQKNITLLNGRAYKQSELLSEGKYPILRVGNFFSNNSWYYSDMELESNKYCDNGDLLYAWSASFGPKIWDGGKVIYHYHIWKVLFNEKYDKRFLCKLLEYLTESFLNEKHGSTMFHLTKEGMEKTLLIVPPLDMQLKYVSLVEQSDKSK